MPDYVNSPHIEGDGNTGNSVGTSPEPTARPTARGRFDGDGWVQSSVHGQLKLHAGDESCVSRYDLGDLKVSGLITGPPRVSFSRYLLVGDEDRVTPFLRLHKVVDVELEVDRMMWGLPDRKLVVQGCRLEDVALVEGDEGTRIICSFVGTHVSGDLLASLVG